MSAWYRRDDNALPPEYVLQPRRGRYEDPSRWEPVEARLRTVLRACVEQLALAAVERVKYFASATHQAVMLGALRPDGGIQAGKEHVFAYLRSSIGVMGPFSRRPETLPSRTGPIPGNACGAARGTPGPEAEERR